MNGIVRLERGAACAEIASRGAELCSWTVGGRPLIWTPDPAVWPDTAPVLFPVVGWTREGRVTVDGKSYPLGLHGFARAMPFAIERRTAESVTFALTSSAETRALYPFEFDLRVTYQLSESSLETMIEVRNAGDGAMPYACGLHPGFCWPFVSGACSDYAVIFAEVEEPSVPVITTRGLFSRETRPVPFEGRSLPLSTELFAREALCFLDARSQSLRFAHKDGAAIELVLSGFPHVALWARPTGRFLCLEAWTGRGDDADSDGDLRTKPSMIHLDPGASRRHGAVYRFSDA